MHKIKVLPLSSFNKSFWLLSSYKELLKVSYDPRLLVKCKRKRERERERERESVCAS